MPIPKIPESAPFSVEQRAWLDGFLASWVGTQVAAGKPVPTEDLSRLSKFPGGRNSGNGPLAVSGATANGAATTTQPAGTTALADPLDDFQDEGDYPWHDDNLDLEERMKLADGRPFDQQLMAAMAQLDCGACGYMCDSYAEAIATGEEKSLALCSPGGKETLIQIKKLVKKNKTSPKPAGKPAVTPPKNVAAVDAPSSRSNPIRAKVTVTKNLNFKGSKKHTQHVELSLGHSGLEYQVGDSLGVLPLNDEELIEQILEILRSHGTEPVVAPDGVEAPLREALKKRANLRNVDEELVELALKSTGDPDERKRLKALLDDDHAMADMDLLDLLQMAPKANIDSRRLSRTLTPLLPRLYSIASSLKKHPEEAHLTIARVAYELNGRERKGVASTMFTDRLEVGDTVQVYVHSAKGFGVPGDDKAPMIMVGPGTGVAPFRAFLEERELLKAEGENWLIFGDQHEKTDFLYGEEFKAMQKSGLLNRLSTAFSRDQEKKIYVQDRMIEEGKEFYDWLEKGAYFFVCGDAQRMAGDVDRALHSIIETHGGKSPEEAKKYVADLKQTDRYVRDVY